MSPQYLRFRLMGSKLQILDLSANAGGLTEPAIFSSLPQLQELYLRRMQISEVPSDLLHLQQLRILDLSQNTLQSVPEGFKHLTSLTELYLSDNNITTLPPELVHTWGKGYCGALGHGDEIDKTTPELLDSLKRNIVVQVCASKRKTFVLADNGSLYGFGWMGFGSLGFPDRGASDKISSPRVLDSLKGHHISQVSTGLYHTVVVTNCGRIFGFGDNERAQLGHDSLRGCVEPTEIFVQEIGD